MRACHVSAGLAPRSPRLRRAALDLALPGTCSGCGREGEPLCAACARALDARLELPGWHADRDAGRPPAPLLQLEWCAPFAGAVRAALHDLKYRGERRLAGPLGRAVARRWARVGEGATLVVPVPVHAERERRRGYDQAALIAGVAAAALELPYVRALERERATTAQFELGRDDRAANVAGAFRVRRPGRAPRGSDAVAGRWVLLVDDVVTTGATLAACAIALEARRRDRRLGGHRRSRAMTGRRRRSVPLRGRGQFAAAGPIRGATILAFRGPAIERWRVKTIVKGKNVEVPERVRDVRGAQAPADRADPG